MVGPALRRRDVRGLMPTRRAGWRGALGPASRGDRGSVVLETAIGIPVLVCVGTAMVWGIGVGVTAMSMADTARDAARAIARGEPVAGVLDAASRQSPSSMIDISQDDSSVTVRVRRSVSMPVLRAIDIDLEEQSVAEREDAW